MAPPNMHMRLVYRVPAVFTLLVFLYVLQPSFFRPLVGASAPPLSQEDVALPAIQDSVVYPSTIPGAFQLGLIVQKASPESLQEARHLLGSAELTQTTLDYMITEMKQNQTRQMPKKVEGWMSLLQFICVVAVIGMMLSIRPFLMLFIGPYVRETYPDFTRRVIRFYNRTYEFHEVAATLLCFSILLMNERYPEGMNEAVALLGYTAAFISYLAFRSRAVPPDDAVLGGGNGIEDARLHASKIDIRAEVLAGLCAAFLAVYLNTQLFGMVCVGFWFHALGFGFIANPAMIVVGFQSESSLARCIASSSMFLAVMVPLYAMGIRPDVFRPFYTPVFAICGFIYFLSVYLQQMILLHTNEFMNRQLYHVAMVFSLLAGLFVGLVLAVPSLYNISVFFVFMELVYLIHESDYWKDKAMRWMIIFAVSVKVFVWMMILYKNPQYIKYLFMV